MFSILKRAESVDPLSSATPSASATIVLNAGTLKSVSLALVVEATVVDGHIRIPLDVNIGRGCRRELLELPVTAPTTGPIDQNFSVAQHRHHVVPVPPAVMLIEMTLVPAMLERDRMCEVQDPVDVEAGQFETSVRFVAQRRLVLHLDHQSRTSTRVTGPQRL